MSWDAAEPLDKRARLRALLEERAHTGPLSFGQERLWFIDQAEPGTATYNIVSAFRLYGLLDIERLERALSGVVARHASLRTRFAAVDGRPAQVVGEAGSSAMAVVDLSSVADAERHRLALERVSHESERPFDLGRGPLFRGMVVRLGPQEQLLLLTLHHIIADGWSMGVVLRDLSREYRALTVGEPSPQAGEPALEYRDFAVQQRAWLQGERLERLLSYWRDRLAGCAPLQLPTDRPRPAEQSFRGARRPVAFGLALTEAVKAFSQREGVTLFVTLLAGFQSLLARYSGQVDIAVGVPIASRTRKELEDLVGFLVNSLVMRTDCGGSPTFREMVRRVRSVARDAYAHQEMPFERLVDDLQTERSLDRNPLFQVAFALQNTPPRSLVLPGLDARPMEVDRTRSKLDFTLSLESGPDGLEGFVEYSTDLFDDATIARMTEHYLRLMECGVLRPETRLRDLPLLGEHESRRSREDWNRTTTEYPRSASIAELFERQARARPDKPAVVWGTRRLSYSELDRRSNQLARFLRSRGVGVETRVGVCLERSFDLIVALLGILKAGGAYVPLDPAHPSARLAFVLEDAGLDMVLTHERLIPCFRECRSELVCLDRDHEAIAREGSVPVEGRPDPEDLAYVTYTSGSTGVPKGVETTHRAVVRLLFGVDYADLDAEQVFLQLAPVTFDASTFEVWGALLHGGQCVLYPEGIPTAAELGEVIRREGVTTLWLTASLFNALVDEAPEALEGVKQLLIGGEPLSVAHVRRGYERLAGTRIINGYGPTEGTTFTCCYPIPRDLESSGSIPIGRPIGNSRVYLLDEAMRIVPAGVAGELYVGGDGLARGYAKRPDLTAERFLPDPFAAVGGSRLYRTGDRARYLADGRIEFLGRTDGQLKVRGYRIEVGEIEAVLCEHSEVKRCAVVASEDGPGARRLAAYVVGTGVDGPAGLTSHLRSRLPEYMVPASWVFLRELPLTANGKVDRVALGRLATPVPEIGKATEPANVVEERLTELWKEVLRLDRVGVDQNFFELGGDSILSIQLAARARRTGIEITPKQIFRSQTIRELAAVVEWAVPDAPRPEERPDASAIPLTPVQHWFFERSPTEPSHFNQWMLLDATEAIHPARLDRALQSVMAHHEAFDLRYEQQDGQWRQFRARSPTAGGLVEHDLVGLSPGEQQEAIDRLVTRLHLSLDLSRGPLWRAALFHRGGAARASLVLVAHHLVVDGVSWRILLDDLEEAYRELGRGDGSRPLPARTTSFAEWARRLSQYGRSGAADRQAAFWLEQALVHPGLLPRDESRPEVEDDFTSARKVSVWLEREETARLLRDVPRAYGAQVDETLLAATAPVLARWAGTQTLLIDLERHGREPPFEGCDLSRTVGWFTAICPVALRLDGIETHREALLAVKEQMRSLPSRGLGYGILRYLGADARVRGALGGRPQAPIGFNYLGQFDQLLGGERLFRLADEAQGFGASGSGPRPHPLDISARVVGGRLRVDWTYGASAHRPETIQSLAEESLDSLRSLIEHARSPDAGGRTPSDFPLARLDQATLDRTLGRGRGIETVHPLSPLQQGMHFHATVDPESTAYVVQLTQVLEGECDVACLKRAWEQTVARHGSLRSSFVGQGLDEPLQVVWHESALPWEEQDWRGATEAEGKAKLQSFLAADRARRFDLGQAPLCRVTLVRTEERLHRMVWSFHHLLLDGWSLPIVIHEVFRRYDALRRGVPPRVPPVRPYQDFVAWLQCQDQDATETFWRARLRGFTSPTVLRLAAGPAPVGKDHFDEVEQSLSSEQQDALQSLARSQRVTLNAVLQGAWALLLGWYSGEADVVFGTVVSGRPAELEGVESMVGVFINTLPMRAEISWREHLGPWLRQHQARHLEMLQFPNSSLARMQRWSDIPDGGALFESLFLFENYPQVASLWSSDRDGLRVRDARGHEPSVYPLTVVIVPRERLSIRIKYDRRRFESAAVGKLLDHYVTLLEAMASQPQARLSELALVHGEESRRMLSAGNDTRTDFPRTQNLPQLFEAQVERSPRAVAVVFGEERLTYQELNARANHLAGALRSLGLLPEARVGLHLERSVDLVVAMLAVLKAGGAYVPLDPACPPERLAFMLRDAGATAVVTQRALRDRLPKWPIAQVCLDAFPGVVADDRPENLDAPAPADALAYVTYTSGSTGEPKGVAISHRAVARLVLGTNYLALGPDDVVMQASNPSFDAATFEIWGPLLNGGQVLGVDRETTLWPREFARRLREGGVTVLFLTTALFNVMARDEPQAFASLRCLLIGGEVIDPRAVRRVLSGAPPKRLLHVYGPTESTTFATWYSVERVPADASTIPIGRPISNTTSYLLDAFMNPVPDGLLGELYLGGEGLARGYLGRADLTAERFVPDPFGGEPGARLYKTGDRCRRAGGEIEFHGRADQQVKLRGHRIELGEIEAVLKSHPGVRDAVAVLREDEPGDKRLVAYVESVPEALFAEGALRTYLSDRLPEAMVPSFLCPLVSLPLSANGKVDRKALPAPGRRGGSGAIGILPDEPWEKRVASVWRDVLRLDHVGIDENFFEVGGDSLRMVAVFNRLLQDTQKQFPLVTLFQYPTVRSLARFLRDGTPVSSSPSQRSEVRKSRRAAIAQVAGSHRRPDLGQA